MSYRSYDFTQGRAIAILAWYLGDSALTKDQLERLKRRPALDWPSTKEIDGEVWTITRDESNPDELCPSEVELNTVSDWDYWHLNSRPEDFS